MKNVAKKIVAVAAVATALTVSLAGCSSSHDTSTAKGAVAAQYETFFNNSTNINGDKAAAVYKEIKKLPAKPTTAQQQKVLQDLTDLAPTSIKILDLSGLTFKQKEVALVNYTLNGVTATGKYHWSVNEKGVTVDGSTATVNKKYVTVDEDGKNVSTKTAITLKFVKVKGTWLVKVAGS